MKKSEIAKEIQKHNWVVWVGYILNEDHKKREIEYYGKFADSKRGAIGAAKVLMNNTSPYRVIIQNCKPFHEKLNQSLLDEFFTLEEETRKDVV